MSLKPLYLIALTIFMSANALAKDHYAILMAINAIDESVRKVKIAIGDEKGNPYAPFDCSINGAVFSWNYPKFAIKGDWVEELTVSNNVYRAPSFYSFSLLGALDKQDLVLNMFSSLYREDDHADIMEIKRDGIKVEGFVCSK